MNRPLKKSALFKQNSEDSVRQAVSRAGRLLLISVFLSYGTSGLVAQETPLPSTPAVIPAQPPAPSSGVLFRLFNALNYENEVRVFLDDEILVSNMMPGEFSAFAEGKPGSHRLVIKDLYAEKNLFQGTVEIPKSGCSTAVVFGTPENAVLPPKVISLQAENISPLSDKKAAESAGRNLFCKLVFLSTDYAGDISLKIGSSGRYQDLKLVPGQEIEVKEWPVAAMTREGEARLNPSSEVKVPLSTMLFNPAKETVYFCLYYRPPQAGSVVQAIYLQGNEDGNRGYHESDDRPAMPMEK